MKNKVAFFILGLILISCQIEEIVPIHQSTERSISQVKYSIKIDSVLTEDGIRSIPIDRNGYYHVKITKLTSQQFHRITGRILEDGKEPKLKQKVYWESNLYWIMKRGSAFAIITESYVNYFTGEFTIVKLPPLINSKDELVPTVNSASYNSVGGRINTIISPIMEMKGDTMIVKATSYKVEKPVYTKIVLD